MVRWSSGRSVLGRKILRQIVHSKMAFSQSNLNPYTLDWHKVDLFFRTPYYIIGGYCPERASTAKPLINPSKFKLRRKVETLCGCFALLRKTQKTNTANNDRPKPLHTTRVASRICGGPASSEVLDLSFQFKAFWLFHTAVNFCSCACRLRAACKL